ncbi:hypothetical protein DFP72DRAFT_841385 [Ephemerocybe angulata]|uniref:Uncharacterized protein n=1 Tax=Ephemerocybe angulata TaxID=980116 RepID=A0A8H6ICZ4_9AGAR|nr:hypothetical protein DFP72DRAFT_841385 [Tulosesus angulatus]
MITESIPPCIQITLADEAKVTAPSEDDQGQHQQPTPDDSSAEQQQAYYAEMEKYYGDVQKYYAERRPPPAYMGGRQYQFGGPSYARQSPFGPPGRMPHSYGPPPGLNRQHQDYERGDPAGFPQAGLSGLYSTPGIQLFQGANNFTLGGLTQYQSFSFENPPSSEEILHVYIHKFSPISFLLVNDKRPPGYISNPSWCCQSSISQACVE